MKDKNEIVSNWLPRYTGVPLEGFGEHVLLTNFGGYLNTFSRLTGKALAAHIHKGKRGHAGPVVVPLCGPCRNGQVGKVHISKAVVAALEGNNAYVNVHTAKNAAGEIRGQVKVSS